MYEFSREFTDFSNDHSIKISKADSSLLLERLSQENGLPAVLELFKKDIDRLATCAAYTFSKNLISSVQLATLLQLRTIQIEAIDFEICCFVDNNQLNHQSNLLLDHFFNHDEKKEFLTNLLSKPYSERYYFRIKLARPDNSKIEELVLNSHNFKLLYLEPEDNSGLMIVNLLALGAEDALLETRYGQHAKKIFPLVGKISIDQIDHYMQKAIRPIGFSYPGIENINTYHSILTSPFYVNLHDRIHRLLISSIHNKTYHAVLFAIERARLITGIKWSREIWDSSDMEVAIFITQNKEKLDTATEVDINADFIKILNNYIFTQQRPSTLFMLSPMNDMAWLLFIDFFFNKELWKSKSISPDLFKKNLIEGKFYRFVSLHQTLLRNKNPAQQIAIIKLKWFELQGDYVQAKFVKTNNNYLQIEINDYPIILSKDYWPLFFIELKYLSVLKKLRGKCNPDNSSNQIEPIVNNIIIAFNQYPTVFKNWFCWLTSLTALAQAFPDRLPQLLTIFKKMVESYPMDFIHLFNMPDNLLQLNRVFMSHFDLLFDNFKSLYSNYKERFSSHFPKMTSIELLFKLFPQREEEIIKLFELTIKNNNVCNANQSMAKHLYFFHHYKAGLTAEARHINDSRPISYNIGYEDTFFRFIDRNKTKEEKNSFSNCKLNC